MKRWFIEKNGRIIGNKIGYETKKEAVDDVRNIAFNKWKELMKPFPFFVEFPNAEQSGIYFEFKQSEDILYSNAYLSGKRYEFCENRWKEKNMGSLY